MALRVTQRNMYSNVMDRMNNNLSAYMDTHLQSSTQRKVNKPSDDPYGASQIMRSYTQLSAITQYKDNVSVARSWLSHADGVLSQVDTTLSGLLTLLEQGSTGTYNEQQRRDMGMQAREILEQTLTLANAKFNGSYIFGGHQTGSTAFGLTSHAHSNDPALADVKYTVKGDPGYTTVIQFTGAGALGAQPAFRYSTDGGTTWEDDPTIARWAPGPPPTMHCGGDVSIELDPASIAGANVTAVADPANPNETANGTWIYVRPTAEYLGDTNDPTVVQTYPYTAAPVGASGSGVFNHDVAVRVDNVAGGAINYSYSIDGGVSWTAGEAADVHPRKLYVAGGFLNLDASPAPGDQFIIRPNRADIDLSVGSGGSITINNVGGDVFGGLYEAPFSTGGAQPLMADEPGKNLFEIIGKAVGYLESNSQHGCAEALKDIKTALAHINTTRTSIGARVNRADEVKHQLEQRDLDENDRLSDLEDADLSEVMTRLAQQELAYRTVLQSSSMIMQISLINFM